MRIFLPLTLLCFLSLAASSQEEENKVRGLSLEEYGKAKSFQVADLDKDTYLKIENTYILDKGEMPPPYYITGDDGLRKRIDLYKLMEKASRSQLGTVIYYTSETGQRYTAVLPTPAADAKVWEAYFNDIHAINKQEENYVLKLAYVISKELSQAYTGQSRADTQIEGGTYGTEICFPGNMLVKLSDGRLKALQDIQIGETIVSVGAQNARTLNTKVTALTHHEEQTYALTRIMAVSRSIFTEEASGIYVYLEAQMLDATPNHPILTTRGQKQAGKIAIGDKVWVADADSSKLCTVFGMYQYVGPKQAVYSLEVEGYDNQPLLNDIAVRQKE